MFGDAHTKGAFSRPQFVILGVFLLASAITAGLALLGLSIGMSGVVFVVSFIGLLILARPLFEKVEPQFERVDQDN